LIEIAFQAEGGGRGSFYLFAHPDWNEMNRLRMESLLRMGNPENPAAILARTLSLPGQVAKDAASE
jgi:hypothetical protein